MDAGSQFRAGRAPAMYQRYFLIGNLLCGVYDVVSILAALVDLLVILPRH